MKKTRSTAKMESLLSLFDPADHNQYYNKKKEVFHDINKNALPPEPELGNIEYKLQIINPSKERFEHLVTQMKWRLKEGQGEAVYKIGVEDTGVLTGLTHTDMNASLQTLHQMALKLGATTTILRDRLLDNNRIVMEVLVRKVLDDQNNTEIRIAALGNADAGKSTLLGVLTNGRLDNGKGSARLNMIHHLHEVQSGRTSSISHEILGFNPHGQEVNYSYSDLMTAEEICEASTKLITFLDLPGHKKYIRTTTQGLSGYSPHYAMLVVSSTAGFVGTTHDHLNIAVNLNIPFFVVITKTDLIPPERSLQSLGTILKQMGIQKTPMVIKNIDDAITAAGSQLKSDFVPVLSVSSVTGDGLKSLSNFFSLLQPAINVKERERLEREPPEFQINETFRAEGSGQIVAGLLTKGTITEGMQMKIGPNKNGSFTKVVVQSIHRNKIPRRTIKTDQTATIRLDEYIPDLRYGMVLLDADKQAFGSVYFQAKVFVLFHPSALCIGSQTTIHVENIRQTAVIVGIFSSKCIHTNEKDSVMFRFTKYPEYVCVGQRLLFREGRSKGIGEITQVFPLCNNYP